MQFVGEPHIVLPALVSVSTLEDDAILLCSNHNHVFCVICPGSREAAFVHALMAASVAHETTARCSSGHHPGCRCKVLANSELEAKSFTQIKHDGSTVAPTSTQTTESRMMWKSCHANIEYGLQTAREFIAGTNVGNGSESWSSARMEMNAYNREAGLEVSHRGNRVARITMF